MAQLLLSTQPDSEQETYCNEIRTSTEALMNVVQDLIEGWEMIAGKIKHEVRHTRRTRHTIKHVVPRTAARVR